MANFEQFVRDVLDGKSEPFLKSEPIPDNTNADVKVMRMWHDAACVLCCVWSSSAYAGCDVFAGTMW